MEIMLTKRDNKHNISNFDDWSADDEESSDNEIDIKPEEYRESDIYYGRDNTEWHKNSLEIVSFDTQGRSKAYRKGKFTIWYTVGYRKGHILLYF